MPPQVDLGYWMEATASTAAAIAAAELRNQICVIRSG